MQRMRFSRWSSVAKICSKELQFASSEEPYSGPPVSRSRCLAKERKGHCSDAERRCGRGREESLVPDWQQIRSQELGTRAGKGRIGGLRGQNTDRIQIYERL